MEVNENRIYDALEKAGISYEVLRTEDGWLEIGFCVGFDRGKFKDWYAERVGHKHWVLFHKVWNQEWQDEEGNNPCFETKRIAISYLKKAFGLGDEIDLPVEIRGHEQDCPAIDGFGCKCEEEVK